MTNFNLWLQKYRNARVNIENSCLERCFPYHFNNHYYFYRLPNYYDKKNKKNRKNERKQELSNVFVWFKEGKNNCLIFFESYWRRYWTHYIGRSVVRFSPLLQLRRQLIIIIKLLCKQTLLTDVYEKSRIQRGWQRCDDITANCFLKFFSNW